VLYTIKQGVKLKLTPKKTKLYTPYTYHAQGKNGKGDKNK
jgi:hypothetical protein